MKNAIAFGTIIALALVTGCGTARPVRANWVRAYDSSTKSCVEPDTDDEKKQADYEACEKKIAEGKETSEAIKAKDAPKPSTPVAATTPSADADSDKETTKPKKAKTPPVVEAKAPAPMKIVVVPAPSGPFSIPPAGTALSVYNNSDYYVQWQSDQIAPMPGGQGAFTPALVLQRSGVKQLKMLIPPHTKAKFVFLLLNGGMNDVYVRFVGHTSLGPVAPAPAMACTKKHYEPTQSPTGWDQTISNGDFSGWYC